MFRGLIAQQRDLPTFPTAGGIVGWTQQQLLGTLKGKQRIVVDFTKRRAEAALAGAIPSATVQTPGGKGGSSRQDLLYILKHLKQLLTFKTFKSIFSY